MFDIWGRQRCTLARKGYPRTDLFETLVSRAAQAEGGEQGTPRGDAMHTESKDVTTARLLVEASGALHCKDGTGGKFPKKKGETAASARQSVLERIRPHEVWKDSDLWESIFEDQLHDAGEDSDFSQVGKIDCTSPYT